MQGFVDLLAAILNLLTAVVVLLLVLFAELPLGVQDFELPEGPLYAVGDE